MSEQVTRVREEPKADVPAAFWWSLAVCVAAYLGLIALIIQSPPRSLYDETWFLATLDILWRDGLSLAFIRNFPGAPGPTFTLVYGAVQALFALELPWLRLTNFVLMTACVFMLFGLFLATNLRLGQLSARQSSLLAAATFVTLPTVAASSGMTLTEIPAMVFALLFLWFATLSIDDRKLAFLWSPIAGLALGMAVLGRQNYLVLVAGLAFFLDWPPSRIRLISLIVIGACAAMLFTPVFVIWGGLLPPGMASVRAVISPFHGVLSLGYLGLIAVLVAPDIFSPLTKRKYDPWIVAGLALLTVASIGSPMVPIHSLAERLGQGAQPLIGWSFTVVISVLAFAFLVSLLRHAFEHLNDVLVRFATAVVLLVSLTNAKIDQFSSRYVFIVIPFLLLAIASRIRLSWHLPLRLALGSLIALMSLASYFYFAA